MEEQDYKPYICGTVVALPHKCDEWYIGGRKDVEQMIRDLVELLKDPELED